jgi:hypothetical protein
MRIAIAALAALLLRPAPAPAGPPTAAPTPQKQTATPKPTAATTPQKQSPAPTLTVDEIVARYVEARGGMAKLDAIRSVRFTGKAVFGFGDAEIEASWASLQKAPGMLRTEVSLQGLTAVDAYDGKDSWSLDPFQGRRDATKNSEDEARQNAQDADIAGPLVHWKEKGHRVEYLGTEDVDGTDAHKLRVTLKNGDVQYRFLDPDHFLEIRVESHRMVRGQEEVQRVDLGEYEKVDGMYFPFEVGRGHLEKMELNVPVDAKMFAFPGGAR